MWANELLRKQECINEGMILVEGDQCSLRRFYSYSSLVSDAQNILGKLKEKGIQPKDNLIFVSPNYIDYFRMVLVCLLGDLNPVFIQIQDIEAQTQKVVDTWRSFEKPFLACSEAFEKAFRNYADSQEFSALLYLFSDQILILPNLEQSNLSIQTIEDEVDRLCEREEMELSNCAFPTEAEFAQECLQTQSEDEPPQSGGLTIAPMATVSTVDEKSVLTQLKHPGLHVRSNEAIKIFELEMAFLELIDKNEVLNPKMSGSENFHFEKVKLESKDLESEIQKEYDAILYRINTHGGAKVNISLFESSEGVFDFLWVIQSGIIDHPSWSILLRDLWKMYAQFNTGKDIERSHSTPSNQEWRRELQRQQVSDEEIQYWLNKKWITNKQEVSSQTKSESEAFSHQSNYSLAVLDEDRTSLLMSQIQEKYRVTLEEVLLTAVTLTLCEEHDLNTLDVSLVKNLRKDKISGIDFSETIGNLCEAYPVQIELGQVDNLAEALKVVKEQIRKLPNFGLGLRKLRESKEAEVQGVLDKFQADGIKVQILSQNEIVRSEGGFSIVNSPVNPWDEFETQKGTYNIVIFVGEKDLRLIAPLGSKIMNTLVEILDYCCANGRFGYTPSDFKEIIVQQERLNLLPDGVESLYELTPIQQGLFSNPSLLQDVNSTLQYVLVLHSKQDNERLKMAWNSVAAKHEALRSGFLTDDQSRPLRYIQKKSSPLWEEIDWTEEDLEEIPEQLKSWLDYQRKLGFYLTHSPLYRFQLIQISEKIHYIVWNIHCVIVDKNKAQAIIREFVETYKKLSAIEGEENKYLEFYKWNKNLAQKVFPVELAQTGKVPSQRKKKLALDLGLEKIKILSQLSHSYRCSLSSFIFTIFSILLRQLTRQRAISIAYSSSDRNHLELKSVMGQWDSPVLISMIFQKGEGLVELLKQASDQIHEALEYNNYPYEMLVSDLSQQMSLDPRVFYRIAFQYIKLQELEQEGEPSHVPMRWDNVCSLFDLTLRVTQMKDTHLELAFYYDDGIYNGSEVQLYLEFIESFLGSFIEDLNTQKSPQV